MATTHTIEVGWALLLLHWWHRFKSIVKIDIQYVAPRV
jgi:hypothetical protein